MIIKKLLILLLCAVIILSTLVSCGDLGDYNINSKTVMTIGGVDVSYDMYKFFYNMAVQDYGVGLDLKKDENINKIKKEAEESARLYCAQMILVDKYKITLTDVDKSSIDAEIQAYIDEQKGMDNYKKWLSEHYISGSFFRTQLERYYCLDPYLREILFTGIDNIIKMDDETVKADVYENFYRYSQIFVACESDIASEAYLMKRLEIDSAYAELEKGTDFAKVAQLFSDWNVSVDRGVYTTKGEKLIQIEEAALGLEIGEYSEIVESAEGFHIIMRLELQDDYIIENLDDLGYISATRRYNELLKSNADALEIEYTDYFQSISHSDWVEVEYP